MTLKRKNWMITIWTEEFPDCIQWLDDLRIAHMQKEITMTKFKIHWQAFCQFNEQVTWPAVRDHFKSYDIKVHVGSTDENGKIIDVNTKHVNAGIRYVHGYGPLALSKLLDHRERYIILPNEIIPNPVDDDHLEIYSKLSSKLQYAKLMNENQKLQLQILDLMAKKSRACEEGKCEKCRKHEFHFSNYRGSF